MSQYSSRSNVSMALSRIQKGMANKGDWKQRLKALEDLEKLVKNGAQEDGFVELMENLNFEITKLLGNQLVDLRSDLVRQACNTISTMATELKEHMAKIASFIFPNLLMASSTTNKVIRQYSVTCMNTVIENVTVGKNMLMPIINNIRETKSKQMRPIFMKFLEACLSHWPTKLLSKKAVEIENTISFGLECPTGETRDSAGRSFYLFLQHFPRKEKSIYARLPSRGAKIIERMRVSNKVIAHRASPSKSSPSKSRGSRPTSSYRSSSRATTPKSSRPPSRSRATVSRRTPSRSGRRPGTSSSKTPTSSSRSRLSLGSTKNRASSPDVRSRVNRPASSAGRSSRISSRRDGKTRSTKSSAKNNHLGRTVGGLASGKRRDSNRRTQSHHDLAFSLDFRTDGKEESPTKEALSPQKKNSTHRRIVSALPPATQSTPIIMRETSPHSPELTSNSAIIPRPPAGWKKNNGPQALPSAKKLTFENEGQTASDPLQTPPLAKHRQTSPSRLPVRVWTKEGEGEVMRISPTPSPPPSATSALDSLYVDRDVSRRQSDAASDSGSNYVSPQFTRHSFNVTRTTSLLNDPHAGSGRRGSLASESMSHRTDRSESPELFTENDTTTKGHNKNMGRIPRPPTSSTAASSEEKSSSAAQGIPLYLLMIKRFQKQILEVYQQLHKEEVSEVQFAEKVLDILHDQMEKTNNQAMKMRNVVRARQQPSSETSMQLNTTLEANAETAAKLNA
mmetsp:Transcript_18552/g.27774  ORF Transcript_18552/g.27774 Transcript_18552/m.27774 type:complete len:736 (-) Transcript_18552:117-2324(-)